MRSGREELWAFLGQGAGIALGILILAAFAALILGVIGWLGVAGVVGFVAALIWLLARGAARDQRSR